MTDTPDNTGRNQDGTFSKGVSGNPAGRPKGARSKLTEDFFRDMAEAWEERGKAALLEMVAERPHEFVKTAAGLQSKELTGEDGKDLVPPEAVAWRRVE